MSELFFTADTHFHHANIIKYCNRPFKSVEEMDDTLINNWNDKIKSGDTVYHLGDFSFTEARPYFHRLNGNIHFIRGNHDKQAEGFYRDAIAKDQVTFVSFKDVNTVVYNGQEIFMSHYAHRVWNKSHRGVWHLYGHSHGTLPDDPNALSFDCGVDCHNYTPLSFDDVKRIMQKKTFKAKDHHGKKD